MPAIRSVEELAFRPASPRQLVGGALALEVSV
jgi:hypothetical protein